MVEEGKASARKTGEAGKNVHGLGSVGFPGLQKVKEGPMYDVIVVGARVAGAPTAMLLARKGYKVQ